MITNPVSVSRLAGYIYQNMEISENGVAATILTQKDLEHFGIEEDQHMVLFHFQVRLKAFIVGRYLLSNQMEATE